ncbi:MAG: thioredoxin [bacterium]
MALQLNDTNFQEILSNNSVVIVDFSATWCGPCKALSPIVDKIATTYEGRVAVCKMDIEESPETTEQFGIRSVPTVLFFKNGELVPNTKIVGMTQEAKLAATIDGLL